jgi:hypothetical protein
MERITPYLGWIGFVLGIVTAVTSPMYDWAIVTFSSMSGGMLFSSLYIMYSTKYGLRSSWINPGYTGILLNSTPILIALFYYLFPQK